MSITPDGRGAGVGMGVGVGTAVAMVVRVVLPRVAMTMRAISRMGNSILFTAGHTTPSGLHDTKRLGVDPSYVSLGLTLEGTTG